MRDFRVPDLSDIHYMLTILSELGCEVERASGIVTVKAEKVLTEAPYDIVRKMRASVCILGPCSVARRRLQSPCPAAASSVTARSIYISWV